MQSPNSYFAVVEKGKTHCSLHFPSGPIGASIYPDLFPAYEPPTYIIRAHPVSLVQTYLFRDVKTRGFVISLELQLPTFQEAILSLDKWGLRVDFGS